MTVSPPLAGLTILDLTELLPGPFATQQFVEMGAEVIKVERPSGDGVRSMHPGMFLAVNRGKKSIVLNLKEPDDRAIFLKLAKRADVLIEGYRPGVTKRLGVDYATLSVINPGLIYCSISGYGQTGPAREWPGHDLNYAAMAGAVGISGDPDGPPEYTSGVPIGDLTASVYAMISILAALRGRDTSGQGQYLDVSITDAVTSWVTPRYGAWDMARQEGKTIGKAELLRRPGYGCFATSDGKYITIGALETHFFRRMTKAIGLKGYDGSAYESYADRTAVTDEIATAMRKRIAEETYAHWAEIFERDDVPFAPVNSLEDLADDPHLKARNMVRQVGTSQVIAFPVPMAGMGELAEHAPALGEHGAAILADLARDEP